MKGAAMQQTVEVGGFAIMAFSLPSSESAPRCATQTWSCASTATPVIEPKTQWLGSGCGQSGLTCRPGADGPAFCALSVTANAPTIARRENARFMEQPR